MNRHDRRAAAAKAQKEARESSDKRLQGMELRHGGRTLEIRVYVNTDESVEAVVARLRSAAKGPKGCMILMAGGECDVETATAMWEAAFPVMVDAAKEQN